MKKFLSVILIILLLAVAVVVADDDFNDGNVDSNNLNIAEDDFDEEASQGEELYDQEFNKIAEEDIYEGIEAVEFNAKAGLKPDSPFYVIDNLVEAILVGDDPEAALKAKEEKIAEFKEMANSDNPKAAQKALERVDKYNEIIQKEVSPGLVEEVRASSKSVKDVLSDYDNQLEGEEWDDIKELIGDSIKDEDKTALKAKITNKIHELCKVLSDLDPVEYSRVCKTDDDSPKWKRESDRELTKEQEKEAEKFFNTMSQCFENPQECQCEEITVPAFAKKCSEIAPLAVACEEGDQDACEKMDKVDDIGDDLPDYLREVLMDVEDRYGESKHDLHTPRECKEVGATSREECMKVMFKIHAPPECLEALEDGRIDPKDEFEAKKACESIMFDLEAPQECKEAGLRDHRECESYMFKLDAPEECLAAGLTGAGRDDRRKCDAIRFRLDAPQECLDEGIDGTKRDDWKRCEKISFLLDAPEECHQFADESNPWKKCKPVQFASESPQECLDAGLDGTGRDDWKKCNKITFLLDAPEECHQFVDDRDPWRRCQPVQFKMDAPQECLDAGLTGEGRRDWDECKSISEGLHGTERKDCAPEDMHVCDDDGYNCKCVSKEDYDGSDGSSDIDCAVLYCPEGTDCKDGVGCVPHDADNQGPTCGDCASECEEKEGQRLRGTNCGPNGCECFYESDEPEYADGEGPGEPGDFDNSGEAPDNGNDNLGSDDSTTIDPVEPTPDPVESEPTPEPEPKPEPEPTPKPEPEPTPEPEPEPEPEQNSEE